jgi:4-hydroxyphenylpyruvate dioxygenase-like putative hemolysin
MLAWSLNRENAMLRRFGPIMQNAFVVPDLEAAIDHWTRVMHVGPFYIFEHIPYAEILFRGQQTKIDMSAAIAYSGEIQIELIHQYDDAASIYSEFTRSGRSGMQHMGVMTDSVDRDLEGLARDGIEAVQQGRTAWGARFAYVGTDSQPGSHPGAMIELIERGPAINGAFKVIHDAAQTWDGSEPLRRFG